MRYDNPELRERLAAEYVLGTMPRLARQRFARLLADDAELARLVADWSARFAPIDAATPEAEPPAHVWTAIQRRLPGRVEGVRTWRWRRPSSLAWWRAAAVAGFAAAAGLLLFIVGMPRPEPPLVVAILSDSSGEPGWIAWSGVRPRQISVIAVRALPDDAAHAFELWGIAGAAPRPLGLLPRRPTEALVVSAGQLPPVGGTLAVSLEPPAGSPTGQPTGPVLYKGAILTGAP